MSNKYFIANAHISDDGRYRYRLFRQWNLDLPRWCFIMLNPSTADGEQDDPTIRRCVGFAKRGHAGSIDVVNLYAFRSTKPANLWKADDPIGPANNGHIIESAKTATYSGGLVICAWGAHAKPGRQISVHTLLLNHGIKVYALKLNADGNPAHPLMLSYDCKPFPLGHVR